MKWIVVLIIAFPFWFLQQLSNNKEGGSSEKHIRNQDGLQLRTDGLYSIYDTSMLNDGIRLSEHYRIYCPLFVLNSSEIFHFVDVGSPGHEWLTFEYFEQLDSHYFNEKIFGKYRIVGGIIEATIPIQLYTWGKRLKYFEANFQGVLKSRDTIVDWQLVPPYPKVKERLNPHLDYMKKPKILYFIEGKQLLGLDSLYKFRIRERRKNKD